MSGRAYSQAPALGSTPSPFNDIIGRIIGHKKHKQAPPTTLKARCLVCIVTAIWYRRVAGGAQSLCIRKRQSRAVCDRVPWFIVHQVETNHQYVYIPTTSMYIGQPSANKIVVIAEWIHASSIEVAEEIEIYVRAHGVLRCIVSSYRILCPYRTHRVLRYIVSSYRILCSYRTHGVLRCVVSSYRIRCSYRTHGVSRCIVSSYRILRPYGISGVLHYIVYIVLPYWILGEQHYIILIIQDFMGRCAT